MSGVLLAFLRRDYLLAGTSRLAFVWQVGAVGVVVPTMYYLGTFVRPAAAAGPAAAGSGYFAFVVVGVVALGLFTSVMGACAAAIRHEVAAGTLEILLTARAPLASLAAGASLWAVLTAAGQACLYLAAGAVIYPQALGRANLVGAAAISGLTFAVALTLGLFAASFVLITRRADLLTRMLAGASVMLAGVFYPAGVLPPVLRQLAALIPLTYALDGLRRALFWGDGVVALRADIAALAVFLAVLAPAGLLTCRLALVEVRRWGIPG